MIPILPCQQSIVHGAASLDGSCCKIICNAIVCLFVVHSVRLPRCCCQLLWYRRMYLLIPTPTPTRICISRTARDFAQGPTFANSSGQAKRLKNHHGRARHSFWSIRVWPQAVTAYKSSHRCPQEPCSRNVPLGSLLFHLLIVVVCERVMHHFLEMR